MEQDSDRLKKLVDDLLELSKIETKDIPLRLTDVDLTKIAADSVAGMAPFFKDKGIRSENQITAGSLPHVRGDSDKIKQIFLNLLDNAVKYTPEGGSVTLTARQDGNGVEVSIRDTGIGIPEQALPRIFERFYRVDKARSRELGGTGLGLSIVKHLVENHGGKLSCRSRTGQGSTFLFTLPVAGPSSPSL